MSKMMIGIPYLEGKDVNDDGSLASYVGKGKPVVMMVQGNFCPHCTTAKSGYVQFAKSTPSIVAVTIQTDGDDNDKQAVTKLSKVNTSPGVPAFLGFDKSGKFKSIHNGGRGVSSLQKFASSL